jgi:DNA-binding transcriptional ArsR family regulator
MRRDVFQGIADPTRREILNIIAHRSLNVNAVAENFPVSRTAIYKHMKILSECGLIIVTQHGRERLCQAHLKKLKEVSHWIDQYRQMWEERFEALDQYIGKIKEKNRQHRRKK